MLVWTIDEKVTFGDQLQLLNIKNLGVLEEFTGEFLLKEPSKNSAYVFLERIVELDENTIYPVFYTYNKLMEKYPIARIAQNSFRNYGYSYSASVVQALKVALKLGNPLPTGKPKELPYSLSATLTENNQEMGHAVGLLERLLNSGFLEEAIFSFLDAIEEENELYRVKMDKKTKPVISKVIEIVMALWSNRYAKRS